MCRRRRRSSAPRCWCAAAADEKRLDQSRSAVEIRSVTDGHLIARMPGSGHAGIHGIAHDPADRFVAVVGHDNLILWSWQGQSQAIMTLSNTGILHGLSVSPGGATLALADGRRVRLFRIKEQKP